jgi:hypothetical protein
MREILVTNPSLIGTTVRDPNTGGIASGAALERETASMPHSLGTDGTEDSQHIRREAGEVLTASEISDARKAHAAERTLAAAQPEHPSLGQNVDVLTGGASPSAEAPQPVRPDPTILDAHLTPDRGGPAPAATDV